MSRIILCLFTSSTVLWRASSLAIFLEVTPASAINAFLFLSSSSCSFSYFDTLSLKQLSTLSFSSLFLASSNLSFICVSCISFNSLRFSAMLFDPRLVSNIVPDSFSPPTGSVSAVVSASVIVLFDSGALSVWGRAAEEEVGASSAAVVSSASKGSAKRAKNSATDWLRSGSFAIAGSDSATSFTEGWSTVSTAEGWSVKTDTLVPSRFRRLNDWDTWPPSSRFCSTPACVDPGGDCCSGCDSRDASRSLITKSGVRWWWWAPFPTVGRLSWSGTILDLGQGTILGQGRGTLGAAAPCVGAVADGEDGGCIGRSGNEWWWHRCTSRPLPREIRWNGAVAVVSGVAEMLSEVRVECNMSVGVDIDGCVGVVVLPWTPMLMPTGTLVAASSTAGPMVVEASTSEKFKELLTSASGAIAPFWSCFHFSGWVLTDNFFLRLIILNTSAQFNFWETFTFQLIFPEINLQ